MACSEEVEQHEHDGAGTHREGRHTSAGRSLPATWGADGLEDRGIPDRLVAVDAEGFAGQLQRAAPRAGQQAYSSPLSRLSRRGPARDPAAPASQPLPPPRPSTPPAP